MGSNMYKLEELDRFKIPGRGTVIVVDNPRLPELYDPCSLFDQDVQIGNEIFHVRGVESFAIPRSESNPYTRNFGLLV